MQERIRKLATDAAAAAAADATDIYVEFSIHGPSYRPGKYQSLRQLELRGT